MRVITFISIVLLVGCTDTTETKPEPQDIRPARIMTVAQFSDEVVHEFSARIEALQTVDVSFEVGAPLASLPVREGESVKKGALIAALDPTAFQLAVKEAEVQLRLAAQDLSRKRQVLVENGIAKSQVDDARSNYELQKVRLSQAKESLKDATLHAPFDAYVSRRYFDEHVNVRPGEPVVRLLDLTRLQVVINVPEHLLATIGQDRVEASWVSLPFAADRRFDIEYRENRGEADSVSQTYSVSFTMDNPGEWNVLPGMSATAHIHLKASEKGQIYVPASAVTPGPDSTLSVWVFDPSSQLVTRRAIVTAAPQQNGIPVMSGLVPGEQIVVTGASQLQPGMRVRVL